MLSVIREMGEKLTKALARAIAAIVAVALALAPVGAWAQEPQSLDDLIELFDVEGIAGDYVVVVDTSGSMSQGPDPLFPRVQQAYRDFVAAMADTDHVILLTFDSDVAIRQDTDLDSAEKRSQAEQALDGVEANGEATDIGLALSKAVDAAARPGGAQLQTVVLLTDGQVFAPGSRYEAPGSQAWRDLATRASGVTSLRQLSVHGVELGGASTDASLLRDVFTDVDVDVVALPSGQLSGYFTNLTKDVQRAKLAEPVAAEIEAGVAVAASTPEGLKARTPMTITLTSQLQRLPVEVEVSRLAVEDEVGEVRVEQFEPFTATLQPGEQATFDVLVRPNGVSDSLRAGRTVESREFVAQPVGTATVGAADLLLRVGATGEDAVTWPLPVSPIVQAERATGTPWWLIIAVPAVLLLLGLLAYWAWRRFLRPPDLRGYLETADSQIPLKGQRIQLPSAKYALGGAGASKLELFTKPNRRAVYARRVEGQPQVDTTGVPEDLTQQTRLADGDVLVLGSERLTFYSR